jgi:hypothetical protein
VATEMPASTPAARYRSSRPRASRPDGARLEPCARSSQSGTPRRIGTTAPLVTVPTWRFRLPLPPNQVMCGQ